MLRVTVQVPEDPCPRPGPSASCPSGVRPLGGEGPDGGYFQLRRPLAPVGSPRLCGRGGEAASDHMLNGCTRLGSNKAYLWTLKFEFHVTPRVVKYHFSTASPPQTVS